MLLAKILCPLDFSAASAPLLAYAATLALGSGAELCLLHVQEEQHLYANARLPDVKGELARYRALAEQALAPRVTTRLRHGDASLEITREAHEAGADLIVIGSHGQTCISRFLMGSTAEYVVRSAPCATLLIKPQAAL